MPKKPGTFVRIDPEVRLETQAIAEVAGTSLTRVIEAALRRYNNRHRHLLEGAKR